jgi:hypothetical protein
MAYPNTRAVPAGATLLANGVDFVEDDDVQLTVVSVRLLLMARVNIRQHMSHARVGNHAGDDAAAMDMTCAVVHSGDG